MFDKITDWLSQLLDLAARGLGRLKQLYHPRTLKEKGLIWSGALILVTYLIVTLILGMYWSREPDTFNVQQTALARAGDDENKLVTGYYYTSTLIEIGDTLLNKPGGYLANDVMPPGVWLDNIPNWEFGALVMLRDGSAALRNDFARSQSQSIEDEDLANAEPKFNFDNDSWIFPASETKYQEGLDALSDFLARLSDSGQTRAQFFARADNLRQYLEIVEKRLGSYSQRLSASVGQVRINTDLAGDPANRQATATGSDVFVKTSWTELDNVFYEARGATWALLHILKAVERDFADILYKKNAMVSLQQIIRELEATQQDTTSPVILNGDGFALFANYSLTMANYIARANAAIIDLRELLQRG